MVRFTYNAPMTSTTTAPTLKANLLYPQLMQISRAMEARLMHRMSINGHADLTMNLGPPLMLIATGRFRLNTLASKLGMSNQQCNQSLKPIERLGLIERQSDPSDARAKIIVLSEKGTRLITDAIDGIFNINNELEETIGSEVMSRLTDAANALCQQANLIGNVEHRIPFAGLAGISSRYLEKRLMELTKQQGHKHLQMSFSQVLGYMPVEQHIGITISELALQNKVSIQAISRIANELEGLGYVARVTDNHDKRVRRLQLTERGLVLMQDAVRSTQKLDAELLDMLGEKNKTALEEGMSALYRIMLKPELSDHDEDNPQLTVLLDYIRGYAKNPTHIHNSHLERQLMANINDAQLAALQGIITRLGEKS
ncbi:Transcriptional regulator SlyA [BD1-7 clade bacterium]|uniref:Transcriptional regulator SlyA n=1 Tax=BD1-7 clade bacterium TaxID=2029982 RepID=A0A5S9PZ59_9GAMM|nr:Transcriptional regulator SlyA [BD1-7 clade bacterium]CAA0110078.1 Transcriptional regulator SlyA [BD1-7 clade bacterium]